MNREQITALIANSETKIKYELLTELNALKTHVTKNENEIAEKAIDKTLQILSHFKNWVLAFAAVATIAGALGLGSLFINLKTYFKAEVQKWLMFDDNESGGHKALEKLRTEALLNAYTVKLERSELTKYPREPFSLSHSQISRLISLLDNPSTDYNDFVDALRLITKAKGIWGLGIPDDEDSKKIVSLLKNRKISSEKQGMILQFMKNSRALYPVSETIINNNQYDESIRILAFENLKLFNTPKALLFAQENLNKLKSNAFKFELAEFLIKNSILNNATMDFIRNLRIQKPELWFPDYFNLIYSIYLNHKLRDIPFTSNSLNNIIEHNANLSIISNLYDKKYISISFEGNSSTLKNPTQLLSNEDYISKLIKQKPITLDRLIHFVHFFEIKDSGNYITTFIVSLNKKSTITTKDARKISSKNTTGYVWLRIKNFLNHKELEITWRDRTGIIHSSEVAAIQHLESSKYKISYDPEIIKALSFNPILTYFSQ